MNAQPDQPLQATVPFQRASAQAPLILVDVRIDQQGPFKFVLDTGASASGLSRKLADRLRLADGKQIEAQGCGASVQASSVRVGELSVGPLRLKEPALFVTDLSPICGRVGGEIDGILGHDFLHRWRVLIDYPEKTVTFSR